jgi:dGTPase
VERKGQGWNLCLQTLDGILCHDGEIHNQQLAPNPDKTFSTFEAEIAAKKADPEYALIPMTTEGCVVRMADTIAYIGRDLEDAIRLGILDRREIPQSIVRILGNTNGTIVYRLVTDVIQNSHENQFVAFSPEISDALKALKAFNLEHIYLNPRSKVHSESIQRLFSMLFEMRLEELETHNRSSDIFTRFLADMSETYIADYSNPEIVRDYIAGMTDRYFLHQFPEHLRPKTQF